MKLYSTEEVAQKLKVDVETIRRFIWTKQLIAFKIGKNWRIKEEDLTNFIEKKPNIKEVDEDE